MYFHISKVKKKKQMKGKKQELKKKPKNPWSVKAEVTPQAYTNREIILIKINTGLQASADREIVLINKRLEAKLVSVGSPGILTCSTLIYKLPSVYK